MSHLSPWLSGQWLVEGLYVIDVKNHRYALVAPAVGFVFLRMAEGATLAAANDELATHGVPRLTLAQLSELEAAGLLVPASSSMAADIEAVPVESMRLAPCTKAVLETGVIEARLVASMGTSGGGMPPSPTPPSSSL